MNKFNTRKKINILTLVERRNETLLLTLTCFFSCSVICFAYETPIESQNALNQMHTLTNFLFLGNLFGFFLYFAKLFVVIFLYIVESWEWLIDLTKNLMIPNWFELSFSVNWCWKFTLESISLILKCWERKKSTFPFSEFYDCNEWSVCPLSLCSAGLCTRGKFLRWTWAVRATKFAMKPAMRMCNSIEYGKIDWKWGWRQSTMYKTFRVHTRTHTYTCTSIEVKHREKWNAPKVKQWWKKRAEENNCIEKLQYWMTTLECSVYRFSMPFQMCRFIHCLSFISGYHAHFDCIRFWKVRLHFPYQMCYLCA